MAFVNSVKVVEMIGISDVLQTDAFQRSLSFLESLLMFVEHAYCLECSKKRDTDRLYTTYEELLRMCL